MSKLLTRSLVSKTSIVGGLIGGLVHAGLSIFLWNYLYESVWEILRVDPFQGVYTILGMFLLGFVPVVIYIDKKVISPAIIIGGLLTFSGISSWLIGPPRAPFGGPTPFGVYILLWVGIIVFAVAMGRHEYRQVQQPTSDSNTSV